MKYDFSLLAPDDFENLVADVLQAEWGTRFERFAEGKDGGVDLRYADPASGDVTIVQCKRYAADARANLLSTMKKERAKVERLSPARYILATSVKLTPSAKDEIVAQVQPWCKATGDILAANDLIGMLSRHPQVVGRHFKLWMSATSHLTQVLHSHIFNLTRLTLDELRLELARLIVHPGVERASEILESHHHILIVGNPGIGKTTAARLLLCKYQSLGYEPVVISGDIDEALRAINAIEDLNRKYVLLYDDFLGRIDFGKDKFQKNEDHRLFAVFDRLSRNTNIRLILTTREYILADARRLHGLFDSRADEVQKCTISLGDYTYPARARILFNHLYFSDLPTERLQALVDNKTYLKIVNNPHFSPRIVLGIAKFANSRAMSDAQFLEYVVEAFSDPSEVWSHPLENEISSNARLALFLLWTFGRSCEWETLRSAFAAFRHDLRAFEIDPEFERLMKELDGNFVTTQRYEEGFYSRSFRFWVSFQNPSVEECVERSLLKRIPTLIELASHAITIQQLQRLAERCGKHLQREPASRVYTAIWKQSAEVGEHEARYRLVGWGNHQAITAKYPTPSEYELDLLALAKATGNLESAKRRLHACATTAGYWNDLLDNFQGDEEGMRAVCRLAAQLCDEKGTPDLMTPVSKTWATAIRDFFVSHDSVWLATSAMLLRSASDVSQYFSDEDIGLMRHRLIESIEDIRDENPEADVLEPLVFSTREVVTCWGWDELQDEVDNFRYYYKEKRQLEEDQERDEEDEDEGADEDEKPVLKAEGEERFDIDALFIRLPER